MKQRLWVGCTALILLLTGATQAAHADTVTPGPEPNLVPNNPTTSTTPSLPVPVAITQSYLDGERPVTTLYVRDIPVVTFISSASGAKQSSARRYSDPALRAAQVAQTINQLPWSNQQAQQIVVRRGLRNQYLVSVQGKTLVTLDRQTILAGGNGHDSATEALQVANRLRRLLGDAPPLTAFGTSKIKPSLGRPLEGIASWYGPGFSGEPSASGAVFNPEALTAAHRTLPFGTKVLVTNLDNGRSVVVRINDRGPYVANRIIDLSAAAARVIGILRSGIAPVRLDILSQPGL